jgi:hypothetical protein
MEVTAMATRQKKEVTAAQDLTPALQLSIAKAKSAAGEKLEAKTLANIADIWFVTYKDRLAADKAAAVLKDLESAAYALIIEQMRMQELTAIGGSKIRVGMNPDPDYQPHVKDWEKFYAYVLETKDFSFLERRPGKAAIKERWEDGIDVPGVEKFPVYKLTRNEVK